MDNGKRMLRRPEVAARTGTCASKIYDRIEHLLLPPAVSLGGRTVGWPEREIDSVMTARIAGKDNAYIKNLVRELLVARGWAPAAIAAVVERAARAEGKKSSATLIHEARLAQGKKAKGGAAPRLAAQEKTAAAGAKPALPPTP